MRSDPRLPGKRVRELLEEQGYAGGKTILDDYLREVRPLFLPRPRTFQRTSYRPGALCQFDLWEPSREIPVGSGQARRGYVVIGCLPYSRAGAGTLVFSREAPDLLYGIGRLEEAPAEPKLAQEGGEGPGRAPPAGVQSALPVPDERLRQTAKPPETASHPGEEVGRLLREDERAGAGA